MNFASLSVDARALYLHTVAYATAFAVAAKGQLPTTDMLVQHLLTVPSIYVAPAVPADHQQLFAAEMTIVKAALDELNVLIAGQIADNTSFQDALRAGATDGFWNGTDWAGAWQGSDGFSVCCGQG